MKRMRTTGAAIVVALMLASLPGSARGADRPAPSQESMSAPRPTSTFAPGQVLVQFERPTPRVVRDALVASIGGRITKTIPAIEWSLVEFRGFMSVERVLDTLRASALVRKAEPNYLGSVQITPNDTCVAGCTGTARQWNIGAVNAELGWDIVPGTFFTADEKKMLPAVKVAVIDTKIDYGQPDWVNAPPTAHTRGADAAYGGQLDLADEYHPVEHARWPGPAAYHGTFVAAILGAAANNATQIAGLGYRAQIMPITAVDGDGVANAQAVADGLVWAAQRGARVANLSLGILGDSSAVQDAINYATGRGVLVVAAAGNNANDQPFFPAWHDNAMAVAALDEADRRGVCSNYGGPISVAAPGVGIVSLHPDRPERLWVAPCGTSTAAPHVSALAAMLFAQNPHRTPADVRTIIERTADDDRFFPGADKYFGNGRINFERALLSGSPNPGPTTLDLRATIPPAAGGTSSVTATVVARTGVTVTGAEYAIGSPTSWKPLLAVDGAFDSIVEKVRLDIPVANDLTSGIYRVFVRGMDAATTGAAAVTVMVVDRRAPEIRHLTASQIGMPLQYAPVQIKFSAADDFAQRVTYSFKATSRASSALSYQSPLYTGAPGPISINWVPEPTMVGPIEITVTLTDEGGNSTRQMTSTIVV